MNCGDALAVLDRAGYIVEPRGTEWHIQAPPGSDGERLQPGGAVLPESVLIAIAKALQYRLAPEFKMREVARWN